MEIDFLVRNGIKICPIEVKSGQFRTEIPRPSLRRAGQCGMMEGVNDKERDP